MNQYVIVPEFKGSESFLELARTPGTSGRLFRKHILTIDKPFYYNGKRVDIDQEFAETLVKNFQDKVCDIVQVPVVDDANAHSEDPHRNIGEVVDVKIEGDKVYSYIDARKSAEDIGTTLIGASALMSTNYVDTATNESKGPTLLHVAITNRPHLNNLDDFQEIALSSDPSAEVILLSEESETNPENTDPEEKNTMDLEATLEALKAEHGIDVNALQAEAATVTSLQEEVDALKAEAEEKAETENSGAELAVALSNAIHEAFGKLDATLALSNAGEAQAEALISVVAEAGAKLTSQADEIVSLSGRIDGLESARLNDAATKVVDDLIAAGKILPANKEAMIELRLSNAEIFDRIVPDAPVLDLSAETGTLTDFESNRDLVQSEVTRLLGRD